MSATKRMWEEIEFPRRMKQDDYIQQLNYYYRNGDKEIESISVCIQPRV